MQKNITSRRFISRRVKIEISARAITRQKEKGENSKRDGEISDCTKEIDRKPFFSNFSNDPAHFSLETQSTTEEAFPRELFRVGGIDKWESM